MEAALEVQVDVDCAEDGRALTSLYRWLLQDPDVTRHATVSLVPARGRPGEMGGAFDVINAVVSNGIALGSLVVAYVAWRDSRARRKPPVARITRDGVTVVVNDADPDTIRRVTALLADRTQSGRG